MMSADSSGDHSKSTDEMPADENVPSTSTGVTRRQPHGSGTFDENLPSVAKNVARLRECEDYNMALALQEEEFSEHYRQNRTERQTVGSDFQTSMEEQRQALAAYLMETADIDFSAERDAELARQLQREMEEEEERMRINQARLDEEFARRLQLEEEEAMRAEFVATAAASVSGSSNTPSGDANFRVLLPRLDGSGDGSSGSVPPLPAAAAGSPTATISHSSPPSIDDSAPQSSLQEQRVTGMFGGGGASGFSQAILADPPSYAECMTASAGNAQPPGFSAVSPTTNGAVDLIDFANDVPTSNQQPADPTNGSTTSHHRHQLSGVDALLFDSQPSAATGSEHSMERR